MTHRPEDDELTKKTRIMLDCAIPAGGEYLANLLGGDLGDALFHMATLSSIFSKSDTPFADAVLPAATTPKAPALPNAAKTLRRP